MNINVYFPNIIQKHTKRFIIITKQFLSVMQDCSTIIKSIKVIHQINRYQKNKNPIIISINGKKELDKTK